MLNNNSLSQSIYNDLKERIIKAKIEEGAFLTESALAASFNVSKTPVREALNKLVSEGLIQLLPHKGYFIKELTVKDLQNLLEVRTYLESAAAELAAKNASDEELDKLGEIIYEIKDEVNEEQETNLKKDLDFDASIKFHIELAKMSHNALLEKMIIDILNQLSRFLYLDTSAIKIEEVLPPHNKIYDAIKKRDPELARTTMVAHIGRLWDGFYK